MEPCAIGPSHGVVESAQLLSWDTVLLGSSALSAAMVRSLLDEVGIAKRQAHRRATAGLGEFI
eukprot:4593899-Pyramimonas_sp.AAC.1